MQTLAAEILAAWRRAQRLASQLPTGSPAQRAAIEATDRLAEAYEAVTATGVGPVDEAEARTLLRELEEPQAS
jgi:hypothetical protein